MALDKSEPRPRLFDLGPVEAPIQTRFESMAETVSLSKTCLVEALGEALKHPTLIELRRAIARIRSIIQDPSLDRLGLLSPSDNGETVSFPLVTLVEDLSQIESAFTRERAAYYLQRLMRAVEEIRTSKVNDVNLNRWKEYSDIITDSLWIFPRRDTSGAHLGWYWGNFVPQIPHQLILRYSKKGDWVLDPFVGSGTTLIECRRLGRNGIGVELNPDIAPRARELVASQDNPSEVVTDIELGDSRTVDYKAILERLGRSNFQLVVAHPPYHDIIQFSSSPQDLSNAPTVSAFVEMMGQVVDNFYPFLEDGRFLGIVIGDKYTRGEWVPLGFRVMEEALKRNFKLEGVIVKNFEDTRAKRQQQELWRYRALVGGFYVFKHEYILLFKKEHKRRIASR